MLCVQGVIQHWLSAFLWWFIPEQLSILPTFGKAACMCVSFNVFQYFFCLHICYCHSRLFTPSFLTPLSPEHAKREEELLIDDATKRIFYAIQSVISENKSYRAHTLLQIRTLSFILSRGNGVKEIEKKTDHGKKVNRINQVRASRLEQAGETLDRGPARRWWSVE